MANKSDQVYKLLTTIPKGKVVTYGQISRSLNIGSPRAVGQILHRNEQPEIYPCHRVVFADGSLSTGFAFGGVEEHKAGYWQKGWVLKATKLILLNICINFKTSAS